VYDIPVTNAQRKGSANRQSTIYLPPELSEPLESAKVILASEQFPAQDGKAAPAAERK